MHFPRILLAALSAAALLPGALSQSASQSSVNLPRVMRLCASGICHTLTWNDGHFDATTDGQTGIDAAFGVVRWDREAVELTGIALSPDHAGSYITGIFTGIISPSGNSLDNGMDALRAGIYTRSFPFTMTWSRSDLLGVSPQDHLPSSFRMCGGPCSIQILNGGQYEA
jgi:hypothetical protein